jgi:hypothetical protein
MRSRCAAPDTAHLRVYVVRRQLCTVICRHDARRWQINRSLVKRIFFAVQFLALKAFR